MPEQRTQRNRPKEQDELVFLALGGLGEIGMNASLYGHAGRWLMIDLGVTFGDQTTPGIDVILPDLSFIEAHRDRLVGLVAIIVAIGWVRSVLGHWGAGRIKSFLAGAIGGEVIWASGPGAASMRPSREPSFRRSHAR